MSDYGYIYLQLGGFAISFTDFLGETFPRLSGEFPGLEFTAARGLNAPGNPYGVGDRWNFQALLPKSTALNFQNLYREHRRLMDTRQDGKILLIDTCLETTQLSPRTRAKAPAPFDSEVSSGGWVSFFGQYWAVFESPPEIEYFGVGSDGSLLWACTCSLLELGVMP